MINHHNQKITIIIIFFNYLCNQINLHRTFQVIIDVVIIIIIILISNFVIFVIGISFPSPAKNVPTSVQNQNMKVMKMLETATLENGPQSSRHSQLHPRMSRNTNNRDNWSKPFIVYEYHLGHDSYFDMGGEREIVFRECG